MAIKSWPMWPMLVLCSLVVCAGPVAGGVELRDPQAFFDESFLDLQEELDLAREEGKVGLLIMFEIDDCPFCLRMKQTVLNRSDVQDYFHAHFRILSVNAEVQAEMTDFAGQPVSQEDFALKQCRVRATPVFAFFDLEGKPIKRGRLTGPTQDAEEFLLLGRYIVERRYERASFFRFRRAEQEAERDEPPG
jgi:thioredoxin-related protein